MLPKSVEDVPVAIPDVHKLKGALRTLKFLYVESLRFYFLVLPRHPLRLLP